MDCSMLGFLSSIISGSLLKLMPMESVMLSNHLILCHLLLLPQSFPAIRVFSSELAVCIRWPSIGASALTTVLPMNIQGWMNIQSFRTDWFDFLAAQGTLESLLQHHSLKASVLQRSVFFMLHYKDWIYYCCIKLTKLDIFSQLDFIRSHLISLSMICISRKPNSGGPVPLRRIRCPMLSLSWWPTVTTDKTLLKFCLRASCALGLLFIFLTGPC